MTPPHDILSDPIGGLPFDAWMQRISEMADDDGYLTRIGDDHSAVFIDRSPSVLLVTFEDAEQVRLASANGHPIGFKLAIDRSWSTLSILSHGETWFRDENLYRYFDRLIDDGLFEDFDRVIFYGAEMGAYGALAYSVAAPGSSVIAIQPIATLSAQSAGWDDRFRDMRSLDWTSRFGFAPAMAEGTQASFLIYDPHERLDAMHASMFHGEAFHHLRCPHLGGRIESDLDHMGMLHAILELAGEGQFDANVFYRLYRQRRDHAGYLRHLLDHLEDHDRPYLAAMLCRNAVRRLQRRRFHDGLAQAEARLREMGKDTSSQTMSPAE